METRNDWLRIPLLIYIRVGTVLYYLLFLLEEGIARLGNASGFPILNAFASQKWHTRSARFTLLFPLAAPLIFVRDVLLLAYALVARLVLLIATGVKQLTSGEATGTVQEIWQKSVETMEAQPPVKFPNTEGVGKQVREAVESASEQIGTAVETASQRASKVAETASQRASKVAETASGRIRRGSEDAKVVVVPVEEAPTTIEGEFVSIDAEDEPSDGERVSINTGGIDDLTSLPGVGRALAQRIIDHRDEHGPFADAKALTTVSGIGDSLIAQLESKIEFS